jgi:hypothetical protein
MTDQLSGRVTSVESIRQGVIATAWTGSQMTVLNAADIDRSGCYLTPDDGTTLYHCTGDVVDGDESDIITMDSQPPTDWPTGGTDEDGQAIPTEVRLDLWPEVLDVVAMVDPGDGEVLPVTVPHALRPLLSDGLRGPETMEQVVCSRQGTGWVIDDVLGLRAQVGMDGLSDAVQVAITSANGKTTITHSTTSPDADGVVAGDTWMQHDGSLSAPVVGMWSWDGSAWVASELSGAVLAAIDAGTITTGALSGIGIYSPSALSTPRTEIVGSTLRTVRAGGEGEEITGVQIGGGTGDQMMLPAPDGSPLAGFDEDGDGLAQDMNVNGTLTIGGETLDDILDPLPRGVIARQKLGSTASGNGIKFQSELGYYGITFDAPANRLIHVEYHSLWRGYTAGNYEFRLRYERTFDGTTPPVPTVNSIQGAFVAYSGVSGTNNVDIDYWWLPSSSDATVRMLLTAKGTSSGANGDIYTGDTFTGNFTATDCGTYTAIDDGEFNTGGGSPYSGAVSVPTVPAVKTYTKSWNVAATRTWRGSTAVSGNLMQGYYGGYQRYGLWLFDGSPSSAVGNGTVTGAWLTITNVDFSMNPGGNGTLRLGHFDSTGLPGSPQTSGGGAVSVAMKGGQKLKITLPAGWRTGLGTGAIRGFTLGEGAGTGTAFYGHFSPSAVLTLQYRK